MKALLPLALLLAATPGLAQQPPAQPRPAPRQIDGMSEAGNAIFAKAQAAPDPQLLALVRQQRVLRDQLAAAALQTTVDVDRIGALLRKAEDVQSQIRARNNDRMLAVLTQLPDADRSIFLRGVLPKR
jgi:hypothetical protein